MAKDKEDKLAQDAAAARAANMSYGMWKGLQAPVKIEKKIPEGYRICEFCGKPYYPKTKQNRKYCDMQCSIRACEERARLKRIEMSKTQEQTSKCDILPV